MTPSCRSLLISAILTSSTSLALAVPGYLPHQTNPDIFRMDLVSLSQGQMKSASQHLLNLAKRSDSTTPEDLRATAQLIAIAERLSPDSKALNKLTDTLKDENKKLPKTPEDQLKKSTQLLFSYTEWLIDKNASQESQRLGKLILDPLSYLFPNEELTKSHDASDQETRWKNIVPSITAYQKVAQLAMLDTSEPAPDLPALEDPFATEDSFATGDSLTNHEEMEEEPAVDRDLDTPEVAFHHSELSLKTPLAMKSSSDTRVIRLVDLELNTYQREDEYNDNAQLASYPSNILVESQNIKKLLLDSWNHQFKTEPKSRQFNFKTSKIPSKKHNSTIAAAPMAALVQAAATEGTFRNNLVIIGDLQSNGDLAKPPRLWTYLRSLKDVKKSRVLVPQESLIDFTGFLVLNKPEFFLSNEVFGVKNLQEVLDLSIREREPEDIAEALAIQEEIRKVAETKDIRDLATNIHVRERLKKIKALAPNFASADLLLLQGSGNRPTKYSPEQFMEEAEIFHLFLRPIATKYGPSALEYSELKTKEELFEEKLEGLKKLTAFGQREFFDKIDNLYARFRTLTRECRSDDYDDHLRKEKAFDAFYAVYKELAQDFAEFHGEEHDQRFFPKNNKSEPEKEDDPF